MEQGQVLPAGGERSVGLTAETVRARFVGHCAGLRLSENAKADAAAAAGQLRGDHQLSGHPAPTEGLRPAAVLVPIIIRPEGLTVLLTQRASNLSSHAGQVSFPGGGVEEKDSDAAAAALREAQEEVGLDPAKVELIGRLDTYVTSTRYVVTPVVGLIRAPVDLVPDPLEVAEIFEVPLAFIIDSRNHERHSREYKGQLRGYYVLPYAHRQIWGATAGMLVNLAEVLTR
jgi:8-oxo-dGTP pyrophosphatase MutT (NUDIX family)